MFLFLKTASTAVLSRPTRTRRGGVSGFKTITKQGNTEQLTLNTRLFSGTSEEIFACPQALQEIAEPTPQRKTN